MKISVIHGQTHKGNTYRLTHMLLEQLECKKEDISEFYVNGIGLCVGCAQCIYKDENLCPHRNGMLSIIKAMEEADVIIMDSPNYCMGMSGQLKNFCDHLGYRWMSHRPFDMRKKIGVGIATAAGMGAGKTAKAICSQMSWWSVGRTFRLAFALNAADWEEVSEKPMGKLKKKIRKLANKINRSYGRVKPGFKTRALFKMMALMHKNMAWNEIETAHWKDNGWIS